jgi:hypothetical protein
VCDRPIFVLSLAKRLSLFNHHSLSPARTGSGLLCSFITVFALFCCYLICYLYKIPFFDPKKKFAQLGNISLQGLNGF